MRGTLFASLVRTKWLAIRLSPKNSDAYFLELLAFPQEGQQEIKRSEPCQLDDGWYGLPCFRYLAPSGDPEDPSFDLCNRALTIGQRRLEERREVPCLIGPAQPLDDRECVMLIRRSIFPREATTPKTGIDLRDDRPSGRRPAVERPEVDLPCELLPHEAEPRDPGVRRCRDLTWNVEVEDRLGR
jgi:hypothetical protein